MDDYRGNSVLTPRLIEVLNKYKEPRFCNRCDILDVKMLLKLKLIEPDRGITFKADNIIFEKVRATESGLIVLNITNKEDNNPQPQVVDEVIIGNKEEVIISVKSPTIKSIIKDILSLLKKSK